MFEFGKICICIIIVLILISACLTFILIPKSPTITNNSELRCPSNEWNLINKSGFCFKLFEKSNNNIFYSSIIILPRTTRKFFVKIRITGFSQSENSEH